MPALAHSVSLKSIAAVLGGGRSPVPPPSSFTPADLFANGEAGVLFAPPDFTRYTALGSELVTNGDFSGGSTGWTAVNATMDTSSGTLKITNTAASAGYASISFSTTVGKWYRIVVTFVGGTSGSSLRVGTSAASLSNLSAAPAIGVYEGAFKATDTTTFVTLRSGTATAGLYTEWDNISVRELTEISTATMYQDLLRTTPVTALEQPVATILDLAGPRSELGTTELITNGTFDTDTGWTKGGNWTISGGTAIRAAHTSITALSQTYAFVPGRVYVITFDVVSISAGGFTPRLMGGSNQNGTTVTTAGSYTQAFVALPGNNTFAINVSLAGTDGVIDNVSMREFTGQYAAQSTSAARPLLKQDANGKYYLQFDGTDDWMVTPSIDFTATDSMSVFAGVRKLSDVAGTIAELSATVASNAGSFAVTAARTSTDNFAYTSAGTAFTSINTASGYTAPFTAVLAATSDISADENSLRVNGSITTATQDQGTGNYGNYPLYVGRRGGSSLPYNGRLYSLIVRGAASTSQEISDAETWVNSKTGAY